MLPINTANFTKILESIQPDLEQVEGQASKKAVSTLLNIVEESVAESTILKNENKTLKDEINRLKREQGKPDIKPKKKKKDGHPSYTLKKGLIIRSAIMGRCQTCVIGA
ncbi:MAG: hypothetical protein QM498_03100 [Desulfobacterium sp.]